MSNLINQLSDLRAMAQPLKALSRPLLTDTAETVTVLEKRVADTKKLAIDILKGTPSVSDEHLETVARIFKQALRAQRELDHTRLRLEPISPIAKNTKNIDSKFTILMEKLEFQTRFKVPLVTTAAAVKKQSKYVRMLDYERVLDNAIMFGNISDEDLTLLRCTLDKIETAVLVIESSPEDESLVSMYDEQFNAQHMGKIRTFIHEMGRSFDPSSGRTQDAAKMLYPQDIDSEQEKQWRRLNSMSSKVAPAKQRGKSLSEMKFRIGDDYVSVANRIFVHLYHIQNSDPEYAKHIDRTDPDWGKTAFLDQTKATPEQRFRAVQRTRAEWLLSTIRVCINRDLDRPQIYTTKEKCKVFFYHAARIGQIQVKMVRKDVTNNPFLYFFPPDRLQKTCWRGRAGSIRLPLYRAPSI